VLELQKEQGYAHCTGKRYTLGSTKDIRWCGRRGRDLSNVLPCSLSCSAPAEKWTIPNESTRRLYHRVTWCF